MNKRTMLAGMLSGAMLVSAAAWGGERTPLTAEEFAKLKPTAGLELEAKQVGFIVGGGTGKGMLHFQGKNHPFTIKGGSVGTVGANKVSAIGDVYRLENLADFEGIYTAVGAGAALYKGAGTAQFENDKGVIISLKAKSKGASLSVGVQTVTISFAKAKK